MKIDQQNSDFIISDFIDVVQKNPATQYSISTDVIANKNHDYISNNLMKDWVQQYQNDWLRQYQKDAGLNAILQSTSTNPPQPINISERYPILNDAYTLVHSNDIPEDLRELYNNTPSVNGFIRRVQAYNEPVYYAVLEKVRFSSDEITDDMRKLGVTQGYTYDPWFRPITSNQTKFKPYNQVRGEFLGQHSFQIRVEANHEELIYFWGFESTVRGIPIYIILYTRIKMSYTRRDKKADYIAALHPFNASTSKNYDLLKDYTD